MNTGLKLTAEEVRRLVVAGVMRFPAVTRDAAKDAAYMERRRAHSRLPEVKERNRLAALKWRAAHKKQKGRK